MDSPDPKITEEAFAQLNAAFAKFHRQTVDGLLNVNTPVDHPPSTLTKEDFDAACAMLRGIKHTVPVRAEYHVNPESSMPYGIDTVLPDGRRFDYSCASRLDLYEQLYLLDIGLRKREGATQMLFADFTKLVV